MANAAAKKAAVARKDAAAIYLPLVLGINVVHVLLCWWTNMSFHVWNIAGMLSVGGLQYFAYGGILDSAAQPRKPNDKSLVGGSSLDLLGLTVVIQFGSVLWTPRFYWLLILAPMGAAWTLYSTFRGTNPSTAPSEDPANTKTEKQQPRSEKRRQKKT